MQQARRLHSSLALAFLVMCGCGRTGAGSNGAAGPKDTLRLYVFSQLASLNPVLATNNDDSKVALLAYDDLIGVDQKNHLIPELATTVPTLANGGISKDGSIVRFVLRHGVKWSDGAPFTSADVAFTFARVLDPSVNVESRAGYDDIASVGTPNDYTVVVTLKKRFAPFVDDVGNGYPIVPRHALADSGDFNRDPIGQHPIGTGPYVFKSWQHGNEVEYVANPHYFLGKPKIPKLAIVEIPSATTAALELRTHEIDLGAVESSMYGELHGRPGLSLSLEPRNSFVGQILNTTSPILSDVRVRRAFSMLIDRAQITAKNTFGAGVAAYADLPALFWIAREPKNPYAYDPKAAAALLDAAGWKRGATGMREKNGVPLRLRNVDFAGSRTGQTIDLEIQQSMRDAGIDFSTKYYPVGLYYAGAKDNGPLSSGDFDTGDVIWNANPNAENDEILACSARAPIGFNYARYCTPEMDALQDDWLQNVDPAAQAADTVKIEELVASDVPLVAIYHVPARVFYNPALHRSAGNAGTEWYGIQNWSFATR